jgi:sigma-B regulation protein RsbU (phosphoserine phosphatase)
MLCRNNDAGMFVTVFYGVIDLETGVLTYVNAGHNPPYLIRPEEDVRTFEKTGDMALGIFEENTYHQQTVQLRSGDMVYLFTDGIVEAVDEDYQMYGNKRLEQILSGGMHQNCREVIAHGLTALKKFTGAMDQSDDITSMAIRLR